MQKIVLIAVCTAVAASLNAQNPSFEKYKQAIPGSPVKFEMIPIKAGSFKMGSNASKQADEQPEHDVTLSAFWMGAKEVTHDEFALYLNDETYAENSDVDAITRPSRPYIEMTLGMGKEGGFPANSMKQHGAIMYCKWLYEKTGIFYRLPTEAEWEYACRAGSTTIYPFGNDSSQLKDYAWYAANSGDRYQKTGLKKPNAWGLYDMLGNVQEWVLDQYSADAYAKSGKNATDPVHTPTSKHPLVVRGGDYNDPASSLTSANREPSDLVWNRRDPQIPKSKWWNADAPFVGFRLVRPVKQPTKEEAEKFFETYLSL
ncbi:formylglycine-generating enzyme family protein [Niabella yanshanensis]|uniref:Formylglycine-generating enzyme family protein n=1 Tax=Niabella yanshanensis TaxID=577386 RepID=A0ABZ0W5B0_9BACT|nr:formylglycine-generating enzyme family protein [Niabella yanshanensis]WQD37305.1 formylglycine-generating enzyme family protein [Niabella yanshanensis]